MPDGSAAPIADRSALEAEVRGIVAAAQAVGAPVRVLGSLGVSIHCPATAHLLPSFKRTYSDIDLASYRRHAKDLTRILAASGYVEDRQLAIDSEGRRGLYDHASGSLGIKIARRVRAVRSRPFPLGKATQGRLVDTHLG